MKSKWSVVVVHENAGARESAVAFCDKLVERFWADADFEVGWWDYDVLQDPTKADEAAGKAAEADLILFTHGTRSDLPLHVKKWSELWLVRRGDREGKLAGLTGPDGGGSCHAFLRHLAHRAGMDFLTELPASVAETIPDSPEVLTTRAQQVTTVLSGILHKPPAPRVP